MRRLLLVPVLAALALALPAAGAQAGGFATAGLSSTPEGVAPGEPWKVDITVLQHGRTPLDGLVPRVRIASGGTSRDFVAKPAGDPGVYRAEVVFPSAGRWDYVVLDGFIDAMPHTFPPVQIGDGSDGRRGPGGRRRRRRARRGLADRRRCGPRARRRAAAGRPPAPPAGARARGAGARVRAAPLLAAGLAVAAAGMAVAAFAGGGGDPAPAPAPRAAATAAPAPAGLVVWAREGCGGCHTLAAANSHGTIGPDLGNNLRRMPAAYVKESIVAPAAVTAAGYAVGAMPEDYARRISPDDLDALVAFLVASAED